MKRSRSTPVLWSESIEDGDMATFADVLRLARSSIPKTLIGEHGWARMIARASRIPLSAADTVFGIESRLDGLKVAGDLSVMAVPNSHLADALVHEGSPKCPRAAQLARFLSELKKNKRASPFATKINSVILEYDIAEVEGFPAPGVFLCSADEAGYADSATPISALAAATGWEGLTTELKGIDKVLGSLPPGAAVRWVGAFPDRIQRALRIAVRGLGNRSSAFLSRVGWPGNAALIDGIVSAFHDCGINNHVLALNQVNGNITPGIGLELSRIGSPKGDWKSVLDMMAGRNWCLRDKASALSQVTGSERIFTRSDVWELHCGIHHVKLAVSGCDDRAPVRWIAKGYIGCVLRPMFRSESRGGDP